MIRIRIAAVGLCGLLLCGCPELTGESSKPRTGALGVTTEGVEEMGRPVAPANPAPAATPVAQPNPSPANPAPPQNDGQGIIGKTTTDIGKFDPNANQEVSQQKIQATDPITAPLMAYGPLVGRAEIANIKHAVDLFHAEHGRYPKDYDEFMDKIVKANSIQLPKLPFGEKYYYNEETHELMIARPRK